MSHIEVIAYAKACGLGKEDAERLWDLVLREEPTFTGTWDYLERLVSQVKDERMKGLRDAHQPVQTADEWFARRQRELQEEQIRQQRGLGG